MPAQDPTLEEVAAGVFAYVQPDGGWCLNNAGLVATGDGAVLIDTAATEARARALRAAVLGVCATPPGLLVNTHSHGDHSFGNALFPEAAVVSHENARREALAAGLHLTTLWPGVSWGDLTVRAADLTFAGRTSLHRGDVRIELLHFGTAHTTGDTAVWLPDHGVLHTGDLVMAGVTPFFPMGSLAGSLRAVEELRALGARTVVPGHGPVGGPELLDATEDYLHYVRDLAAAGRRAGRSPRETAAAHGPGPFAALLDAERLLPNLHRAYLEDADPGSESAVDMGALFAEMVEYCGGLPACHA
ncbi:MBL fold metallo-hydrolase [Kitasatospora sp. NPDC059088]|uniref:MBL fold metallo-hydrolase n=1 Tax=Kitasatospora sp. NPDC059088 TaxID=3346722 RepID=UPI00369B8CFC